MMYDEVQTGFGLTGKFWAFEHYVKPDIVAFGKKAQVCGMMDFFDENKSFSPGQAKWIFNTSKALFK